MTQKNSTWHELKNVKIGDYGEHLVRKYLEERGYICYKPVTDGAHLVDFLFYKKDTGIITAGEVKTKPRRRKYPDTGFNKQHYDIYKKFSDEHNMRLFMFFCDETAGGIYGNYLDELDKSRLDDGRLYPVNEADKFGNVIRYYPLSAMLPVAVFSSEEKEKFINLRSNKNAA